MTETHYFTSTYYEIALKFWLIDVIEGAWLVLSFAREVKHLTDGIKACTHLAHLTHSHKQVTLQWKYPQLSTFLSHDATSWE